ncbi:MAG: SRPBCC domain-containing protein [Rhodospirillales bacterium]|nr:SRPBCC domain-containing protein [Rhodospirillales bacterium]
MSKTVDDLVIKRQFKCTKRMLFDAWSQPAVMSNWLYGGRDGFRKSTVTNSFAVGGAYSLTMHMPNSDVHIFGTYTEINRYNRIAFTWTSPVAIDSLVVLDFNEISPNRTELTLTHNLFTSEQARTSHGAGWPVCLDYLQERILAA